MWAKVRGFVPDHEVEREWCYVVSDQGAVDADLLNTPFSKYRRLCHIPGGGHEDTTTLRSAHHTLNAFGADELIIFVYNGYPGSQGYLRRGVDVHQTREWVREVVYPSLWRAVAREYVLVRAVLHAAAT